MNPFQFVLVLIFGVVLMGLTYELLVRRMRHTEARRAQADDAVNRELGRRLDELEERIRVLERIVTDRHSTLADRIAEL